MMYGGEYMLIYAGTKSDFMIDIEHDSLETKLYEKMNRTTGLSELNAWRNSLKEMYITLNDSDIPEDAGVAIEYNIPQTSKRVDFLISGYGLNGKGNVVIVELKQWGKINSYRWSGCNCRNIYGRCEPKSCTSMLSSLVLRSFNQGL